MLDARACRAILNSLAQTIEVHNNMAFLLTLLYCERKPRVADLRWLAAALFASVVLTESRLSLMAIHEADYVWLHDGDGVTVYTLTALTLFPVLAIRRPNAVVERAA